MATIISVHSYRGGTGKSNLSANLASCLVQQGKRAAVIDTDPDHPSSRGMREVATQIMK